MSTTIVIAAVKPAAAGGTGDLVAHLSQTPIMPASLARHVHASLTVGNVPEILRYIHKMHVHIGLDALQQI